jgi:hypothetical protein
MTSARFLLVLFAAVLLCSVSVLAQDQPANSTTNVKPNASEPWRILPNTDPSSDPLLRLQDSAQSGSTSDLQAKAQQNLLEAEAQNLRHFAVTPDGQIADDATCYAIRSYVVARDGKDTDSTHPVSYSTCQPASRYRLRTTDMRSEANAH